MRRHCPCLSRSSTFNSSSDTALTTLRRHICDRGCICRRCRIAAAFASTFITYQLFEVPWSCLRGLIGVETVEVFQAVHKPEKADSRDQSRWSLSKNLALEQSIARPYPSVDFSIASRCRDIGSRLALNRIKPELESYRLGDSTDHIIHQPPSFVRA